MSKKKYPVTKFKVRLEHPLHNLQAWTGWRADKASAKIAAREFFTARYGYRPTFVGEPVLFENTTRRRQSPMLAAALIGTMLGMSRLVGHNPLP